MPNQININELVQKAKASADRESYCVLHRGKGFRIGVGARVTSPNTPSFFVEAIIALADESKEVDLQRLEKVLDMLKKLKAKNYSLAYEDGNCVSCEATKECQSLEEEYSSLKILTKRNLV
jgi:hypothetical protein